MNIVHLPEISKALFHRRTGRISNEIIETTKSWSLCHPSAGGPADCRSPARGPADKTSELAGTDTRPCSPRPGPGCQPRSTQPVPCSSLSPCLELLPPSCSAPVAYPFYPSSWFTSKILNEDMLEKYIQQNKKTMRKKLSYLQCFEPDSFYTYPDPEGHWINTVSNTDPNHDFSLTLLKKNCYCKITYNDGLILSF